MSIHYSQRVKKIISLNAHNAKNLDMLDSPSAGEVAAGDPCLYEQIVQPWEILNTPDKRGLYGYRMRYIRTPELIIYQEQFDLGSRLRGVSPPGFLALSVPIRLGSQSSYWKAPLSESGFPLMFPGILDVVIDSGQIHIIVLVKLSLLRDYFSAELMAQLEQFTKDKLLPARMTEVKRIEATLLALINTAISNPDMLQSPAVIQSIKEDLLGWLADLVTTPQAEKSPGTQYTNRQRALDRAFDYLRENDRSSVSMLQLSQVAGVSQRTLEYAFRDAFDLTPQNFLKLQRFHLARRKLTLANHSHTTVARICLDAGFYHLGRFSTDYLRLFGESPRHTLQRQI